MSQETKQPIPIDKLTPSALHKDEFKRPFFNWSGKKRYYFTSMVILDTPLTSKLAPYPK